MESTVQNEILDRLTLEVISGTNNCADIRLRFSLILNDYQIERKCKDMIVYTEGKNAYFVKRFVTAKKLQGLTDKTLNAYKKSITYILMHIGKDADTIVPADIQMFFARKMNEAVSKRSIDNYRRYLSSFYSYLVKDEIIESKKNPMNKIDGIKFQSKKESAFSDEDIETMRATLSDWRTKAIFEMLLSTGCRVSELVNIKLTDINDDSIMIIGKGEKPRTVFINAKAKVAIRNYISERKDDNPYLFPACITKGQPIGKVSAMGINKYGMDWYKHPEFVNKYEQSDKGTIERIVRVIGKNAGISDVHPHRFRRTCATNALKRGMPVVTVSKMLGHSNLGTTQIYLDISDDDVREAHRKYVV